MRSNTWRYFQLPLVTPNYPKPPHCPNLVFFLPRNTMLARYMLTSFVRPSECLSQVTRVLRRWLNLGSHRQRHTISQDSSLLMSKVSAKFQRGHPNGGAKYRWGRLKLTFAQYLTVYKGAY